MVRRRTVAALKDMNELRTTGDLRFLLGTVALAVAKGEMAPHRAKAVAEACQVVNDTLRAEISAYVVNERLHQVGRTLGDLRQLGQTEIGTARVEAVAIAPATA